MSNDQTAPSALTEIANMLGMTPVKAEPIDPSEEVEIAYDNGRQEGIASALEAVRNGHGPSCDAELALIDVTDRFREFARAIRVLAGSDLDRMELEIVLDNMALAAQRSAPPVFTPEDGDDDE